MRSRERDRQSHGMRFKRKAILGLAGGLAVGLLTSCCIGQRFRGPESAHFDGCRFQNPDPVDHGFWDVMKWMWTRDAAAWPDWIESEPGPTPAARVEGDTVVITFINHSTFLVQTRGLNLLTDPIFSERASPVGFAGPKRVRAPGIRFEQLPKIDVVLISHDHYDHQDLPTLRRLVERDRPRILVGLGVDNQLRRGGISGDDGVEALDWWDSRAISDSLEIIFVPCRHFSGRGLFDRNATLWGSFTIQTPGGRIYFAGDTGDGVHFQEAKDRLGLMRLAILPIGAYEPEWFMQPVHITPEQAVRAHMELQSGTSIGCHFGTFQLTDEPIDEPGKRLRRALEAAGLAESAFVVPEFGAPLVFLPETAQE